MKTQNFALGKQLKKILCVLLAVTMLFGIAPMVVATEGNPPLQIDITTDKVSYGTFGNAKVTVTITNTSNETIENISAKADLDGLIRTKGQTEISKTSLASGESFNYDYSVMLGDSSNLNFIQKLWLWVVRVFRGIFAGKSGGIDFDLDFATGFVQEDKTIKFGKTSGANAVMVWFGGVNNNADFRITDFYSETYDILLNTQTEVTFYAETECINVTPDKLSIYDTDKNFIGYMYDEDSDGIYIGVITTQKDSIINLGYYAQYESVVSKDFEICYYRDFTQAEILDFEKMMAKVKEIEENQRQAGKTEKEIGQKIYNYLEYVDFIENIVIDDIGNVNLITNFGITGVWNVKTENRLGGFFGERQNDSGEIPKFEINTTIDTVNETLYTLSMRERANIALLIPYKSVDDTFATDGYEFIVDEIADKLGGTVTKFYDDDASLEALKKLNNYDIVLFYSHGTLSNATNHAWDFFNTNPYTWTGEKKNFGATFLSADFQSGRIIISLKDSRLGVGGKFYDKYYNKGDLQNTFFHLASCYSMKNDTIADTLISKDASWVQGYSSEADNLNDYRHLLYIIKYMLFDMLTVGEAIELTLADPEAQEFKQDDCVLRYKGDSNYRFIEWVNNRPAHVPADAVEFNGNYYKVFGTSMNWHEAKTYCESLGGHLVTITSQEEQDFVAELINEESLEGYWLGAKTTIDGKWEWITGEHFDYTHDLSPNVPINNYGLMIYSKTAQWTSFMCNSQTIFNFGCGSGSPSPIGFICEWGELQPSEDNTREYNFLYPVSQEKTVPEGYTGIYTAQDLDNIRNNLSGKFILMNDIDLSVYPNWIPVGSSSQPFIGILDGNGYIIRDLQINRDLSSVGYLGLFGYTGNASVVKNCGLIADIFVSSTSNVYVSGFVAYANTGSTIENCFFDGKINVNVQSTSYIGGILAYGYNDIILNNCYNYADLTSTGSSRIGGILGEIRHSSYPFGNEGLTNYLINLHNKGNINFTSGYVGGVAGRLSFDYVKISLARASNQGNISTSNHSSQTCYIGGIIGDFPSEGSLSNCNNVGNIDVSVNTSGDIRIGGIAGYFGKYLGDIRYSSCGNLGNINIKNNSTDTASTIYTGGIVGYTYSQGYYNITMSSCYNVGNIEVSTAGRAYVSGIAGLATSNYTRQANSCCNAGKLNVQASTKNISEIGNFTITSCYFLSDNNNGDSTTNLTGLTVSEMRSILLRTHGVNWNLGAMP